MPVPNPTGLRRHGAISALNTCSLVTFRNVSSPLGSKISASVVNHSERQLLFYSDYKTMIANMIISDEDIDMLSHLPFSVRSDPRSLECSFHSEFKTSSRVAGLPLISTLGCPSAYSRSAPGIKPLSRLHKDTA
jgi:hypothetical protein